MCLFLIKFKIFKIILSFIELYLNKVLSNYKNSFYEEKLNLEILQSKWIFDLFYPDKF